MTRDKGTAKTPQHVYDAFISYSHKADSELAKVLQVRLERWARPWFAARTAKLFRDQVSLTATPHLWTTIAESLDNSGYLILLASTDSAKSDWVPRELSYWLSEGKCETAEELKSDQIIKNRVDRLMIVLTEGQIERSHADEDFDWATTSALPPVLSKLPWEPLWTDLRWARELKGKQIEADERFTEPVLKLLSRIRGRTPQELLDANDREQKRAVSLFRRLSIGLAVLFIAAIFGGIVAWHERSIARANETQAKKSLNVAHMNLLQKSFEDENPRRINYFLTNGNGDEVRRQLRSFDWFYFWRLANAAEHSLKGHEKRVDSVAFSPSNQFLASCGYDGTIRLWDVALGKPYALLGQHGSKAKSVAYFPDGSKVLSTGLDKTIRLWSVPEKKQIGLLKVHSNANCVAVSPNGQLIACGCNDHFVYLWKAEPLEQLGRLGPHVDRVTSLAFTPDGQKLLSTSGILNEFGELKLWLLDSQSEIETKRAHNTQVKSVTFIGNGTTCASAAGTSIVIWKTNPLVELQTLEGHSQNVNSLAASPDGTTLASGSSDGTIKLWDIESGNQYGLFVSLNHTVASISFSRDGSRIASGTAEGRVAIWRTSWGYLNRELGRLEARPRSIAIAPDGTKVAVVPSIVASGQRKAIYVWGTAEKETESVIDIPSIPTAVSYLADSRTLAVGTSKGNVQLWDSETQKPMWSIGPEVPSITGGVLDVAISPDGRFIAFCYCSHIEAWDLWERKLVAEHDAGPHVVTCIAFAPDSQLIAFGGYDNQVKLWDFTKDKVRAWSRDHSAIVKCLAFSPDGRLLASGSDDRTVKLSTLTVGEVPTEYVHPGPVNAVKFAADGRTVVTGGFDSRIRFWDISTGLERSALCGHSGYVNSLAFSHDGTSLVSAGWDHRVVLWRAASESMAEASSDKVVADDAPVHEIMAEPIDE